MDDFILILKNKAECQKIKHQIESFLTTHLKLKLNAKSVYYPDKMGVNFCGYRTYSTHRLLRLSSKKTMKKNVKKWNREFNNGTLDCITALQSINSWIGHASHCNSYLLRKKILNSIHFLYTERFDLETENSLLELNSKQNSRV